METKVKRERIIFLDLMRAFAVLMMVQGHTIDAFLADVCRSMSSPLYTSWLTLRGFTAPIFMFTSGVTFTYLLRLNPASISKNPRTFKGVRRFFNLLAVAYLLRYPTPKIIFFKDVTPQQWLGFFTVDALHLIAFGLLFIIGFAYLGEKMRIKDGILFPVGVLLFFLSAPFINAIDWNQYLPVPVSSYLYQGSGSASFFPLFPWIGYVLGGATLGTVLAHHPHIYKKKSFLQHLVFGGLSMMLFSFFVYVGIHSFLPSMSFWDNGLPLWIYRMGVVLILNGIALFISLRMKSIPDIIKQVGSHTLIIYVVHLVLIFGSAWTPGIDRLFAKSLDFPMALLSALIMLAAMILMVYCIERFKSFRKNRKTVQA